MAAAGFLLTGSLGTARMTGAATAGWRVTMSTSGAEAAGIAL